MTARPRPPAERRRSPLADCNDCREPIRFVQIRGGRQHIAVNPKPNPSGPLAARLIGGVLVGWWISPEHPWDGSSERYAPHRTSCTERPGRQPTPAEAPALF